MHLNPQKLAAPARKVVANSAVNPSSARHMPNHQETQKNVLLVLVRRTRLSRRFAIGRVSPSFAAINGRRTSRRNRHRGPPPHASLPQKATAGIRFDFFFSTFPLAIQFLRIVRFFNPGLKPSVTHCSKPHRIGTARLWSGEGGAVRPPGRPFRQDSSTTQSFLYLARQIMLVGDFFSAKSIVEQIEAAEI